MLDHLKRMSTTEVKSAGISDYLSLIKFSHTVFALPFAFIGFFLAVRYGGYEFSYPKLFLMLLCMVFARSAAMAFNRWADKHIDTANPRTSAVREIPKALSAPTRPWALYY